MVHADEIKIISQLLRDEKVVICPTDTIWGISCNVMSESATRRIYDIKSRPIGKPFILLVSDMDMLKYYVSDLHPRIENLLAYHRKPLTVIYDHPKGIPSYALAKDGSIGIRIVKEDSLAEIINQLNVPIVSTSANFSSSPSPTSFSDIEDALLQKVDYVSSDDGDSIPHSASVIIRYDENGNIEILRP